MSISLLGQPSRIATAIQSPLIKTILVSRLIDILLLTALRDVLFGILVTVLELSFGKLLKSLVNRALPERNWNSSL
jgi:hypothetical protein